MSMPWDNGTGLLYTFQPFKMVPQVPAEDRSVTRSQGDFDRSTATGSVVVCGSVPRRSDPAVHGRSRPADSRRLDRRRGDQDSSLPAVKSTRMETLRAILRARGHSREAAKMMSRCLWNSSLQVYESHWLRFVTFCRTKRWHVFRVRSHHFSTYMMHLFRDGLLPSTIISHRTSVASVLRHWRQRMFIHWNRNIRDIMTISLWIVETVKEAHTQADREYDRVTAHEVRALSASWA